MASDNDKKKPDDDAQDQDLEGTLNIPEGGEEESKPAPPPQKEEEGAEAVGTGSARVPEEPGPAGSESDQPASASGPLDEHAETVAGDSMALRMQTILQDLDVTCTIDPRQLDDEDQVIWDQLVSQAHNQGTSATPPPASQQPPSVSAPGRSSGMESNLLILSRKLFDRKARPAEPGVLPDYEILKVLGKGGMGTVYAARQASLDRTVALKIIQPLDEKTREGLSSSGRLAAAEKFRREQFLSEAVVTGDLDHPNIVPIHDVAKTHEGDLFYSMKQVEGVPWSKVFNEKSLDENLEILLKVADAVAFAHSRGVVHRDIKPENVMLGDFGVVMLMDWGLAVPTPEFKKAGTIRQTTSLGGSPAFMAPELAVGPIDRITPSSDIYLLGATLFQIITGQPPHTGSNLSQCLRAAAENRIVEVPTERQTELYHIAMKAMATLQVDRYETVQQFQVAIREYRSHLESISLAERAAEDLAQGQQSGEYADFSRAVFGFEEALELWPANRSAQAGLVEARLAYAEAAHSKEDFDLGLSLLDEERVEHQPMVSRLREGQRERDQRRTRLKLFRQVAVVLVGVIIIGGGSALAFINQQYRQLVAVSGSLDEANEVLASVEGQIEDAERKAEEAVRKVAQAETQVAAAEMQVVQAEQQVEMARAEAMKAEEDAKKAVAMAKMQEEQAKKVAEMAMKDAEKAMQDAEQAQTLAQQAERQAEAARKAQEEAVQLRQQALADSRYEQYVSRISLARTRIEQNQYDEAWRILSELRGELSEGESPGWEWRRLWYEVNQSRTAPAVEPDAAADGRDVSFSASGQSAIVLLDSGELELIAYGEENGQRRLVLDFPTTAAAISADEKFIAAAGADGVIRIVDVNSEEVLKQMDGHTHEVTALKFLAENLLLSASADTTVRLWEMQSAEQIGQCWHIGPVRAVDAVRTGDAYVVAAAVSDERSGRVVLWDLQPGAADEKFLQTADFLEHRMPVDAVAISPDGRTIASGDRAGRILMWNREDAGTLDYAQAIGRAIAAVRSGERRADREAGAAPLTSETPYRELIDRDSSSLELQTVSTGTQRAKAHFDAVQSLRFNPAGDLLLSASDDFNLKVWDLSLGSVKRTLKGHGGRVRSGVFSPTNPDLVLSAGHGGVREWSVSAIGELVIFRPESVGQDQVQAHLDEIWSASFDKAGRRIVTASRDHTARVLEFDPETLTFKQLALLQDTDEGVLREGGEYVSLFMSADEENSRLYVGGADGFIRVWDLSRGTELAVVTRKTGLNSAFAVSKDGRLILSGSGEPDVMALVWSLDEDGIPDPEPKWKLGEHTEAVTAFAISPDSRLLFTGDRLGEGILWDAETGQPVGDRLVHHRGSRLNAATFSPDGKELLIASDDRTVSRINVESREVVEVLSHSGFVTDMTLSVDGEHLLTISQATTAGESRSQLTQWRLRPGGGSAQQLVEETSVSRNSTGQPIESESLIRSVRFGSVPGLAMATYVDARGRTSRVTTWRIDSDSEAAQVQIFEFPDRLSAAEMAVPLTNNRMLTLNGDAVFLWDTRTLGHQLSYRAHAAVTQASFSSDGRFVATGSRSVKIWDLATKRSVHKLEFPHEGAVRTVRFSPVEGSLTFATGGDDGVVKLWNWDPEARTTEELRSFSTRAEVIRRIRFSADGKLLVVVGDAGFAAVWTTDGIGEPLRLETDAARQPPNYLSCAISEDRQWVLVGGSDQVARLWRLDLEGESAKLTRTFRGHADQVEDVAFIESPDGRLESYRIVTASRDKSARVWDPRLGADLENGQEPREILGLRRHALGVTAVDTADAGRLLMTASLDGTVILWPTLEEE
jgi:WD40 repeat protein/serine/threonine protein kinase